MKSQMNEKAFEQAIERALSGTCVEELSDIFFDEPSEEYGINSKFYLGSPYDFDKTYAIDTKRFWHFLENTQQEELEKLQRDSNYQLKIIQRLDKMVKKYGILEILKKGLNVDDAHFIFFYPMPLASSAETVKQNFRKNEFSVTRQVRYALMNPKLEIDMVLFINGLPLVTMELKNPSTYQTARIDGQKQYRENRDPKETLLNFSRCLVHFTLDTDEVYMTTKLEGKNTFFLPFNKGNRKGKGNPVNPNGYKTAYMWEEILTKESLAGLIEHFVRLSGEMKEKLSTRTLFFPRYHQLDVTRKILEDVTTKGVGQTYLIQHSAGSGKSNSLTWCAYQLLGAYPKTAQVTGAKGITEPLFDSVIVVTDRRLLDKQIRDNIDNFKEQKNIISHANSAKDLKASLESGKKIIITTIQKFPFMVEGMADLSSKRFAIIIDEAHSSQDGSAHDSMNSAMGKSEANSLSTEERVLKSMRERKIKNNASYLAFTATPKSSTLKKFGVKQEDGSFKPFHLYSMKQAIEEGFILDVLANYTTYKSYYEIQKSIEDNPAFKIQKAHKRLKAFVERDQETIATKTDVMIEHFITKVVNTKKLKGKAKGMVITQDIETAILYYNHIMKRLNDKGNPFKVIIAFSGKKNMNGTDLTEDGMNGFPSKDISKEFDKDEYRLLVVANKFLTGFDQPKLTAMYVDKKLEGVLAVQALSRLNRSAPKLGKKTEDLFVLDFFNKVEDIQASFKPYYGETLLSSATDINVLHEIKAHLEMVNVYVWNEVEQFIVDFFNGEEAGKLSPLIDISAQRFNHELKLKDEDKADFKIKAKQFVKIYGQMASIMTFEKPEWEKLFWFLKFLIPKLIVLNKEDDEIDALLESVDLSTYGLERVKLNEAIVLLDEDGILDPQSSNPRGVHGGDREEKDSLDTIISSFNDQWFQGWDATPEEQKVRFIKTAEKIQQHPDYERKYLNNPDSHTKNLAYIKIFDEVMNQQRRTELKLYKKIAEDEAFKHAMQNTVKRILSL